MVRRDDSPRCDIKLSACVEELLMTAKTAKLTLPDGKELSLPVVVGRENEHA